MHTFDLVLELIQQGCTELVIGPRRGWRRSAWVALRVLR
jgi:hypothetical protein